MKTSIIHRLTLSSLLLTCYIQGENQWVVHEKPKDYTSQTFMFTRPVFQRTTILQSLWNNFVYNKKGVNLNGLQCIGIYQQSTPSRKVERFFLLDECKNKLFVSGDANTLDKDVRDIRAEWLNLPSHFKGLLSVNPEQKQYGVIFEYHQDLRDLLDIDALKAYWVSIIVPLTGVENTLNLTQENIHNPGTSCPRDIIESFKQPSWNYLRINGKRTFFGPEEVNVRAGKAYISDNNFLLTYYVGLSIPTGHTQNEKYMFDAIGGFNGHVGAEAGINIQLLLNQGSPSYACCFFMNLENMFLMHNHQCRTFDLQGKHWSRYLLFNKKGYAPNQNIPGVNVLTKKVRVRPYNIVDFSLGWRLKTERLEFEIGYNLWAHGHEVLKLKRPFPEGFEYGIAGDGPINPLAAVPEAATASHSTIACRAPNDATFVPIKESDLDLKSAASPSAITQTAFFAVGGKKAGVKVDGLFGGGLFVEIPHKNTALPLWGIWFKWGAVF